MSDNILRYKKWIIQPNRLETENLYKEVSLSGTEICVCGQCKEFLTIKNHLYPTEIKDLFTKLGIDINKEYELCDYGDKETGHVYSWWFHFVGKIIDGDDCSVALQAGGYTMDLLLINEFFQIGFTQKISKSFFEGRNDLIQVELWAEIPWDTSGLSKLNTSYEK